MANFSLWVCLTEQVLKRPNGLCFYKFLKSLLPSQEECWSPKRQKQFSFQRNTCPLFVAVVAIIAADDRKVIMYYGKHRHKKSILYPTSQNHNILAFSNILLMFLLDILLYHYSQYIYIYIYVWVYIYTEWLHSLTHSYIYIYIYIADIWYIERYIYCWFPDNSVGKESACNAGEPGSIPGQGRPPGEEIGYPQQYSWASLVAQLVNNLPAMWETQVQSLG